MALVARMNPLVEIVLFSFLVLVICAMGWAIWFHRRRATALENLLVEYRQQREATVDMLNRIGVRINTSLNLDGALEIISSHLQVSSHAESSAIFLLEADGKNLKARAISGPFPPLASSTEYPIPADPEALNLYVRNSLIAVGDGSIGFVAKTGEPLLISEALSDPRLPRAVDNRPTIHTMLAAPLRLHQKILGVCALVNRTDGKQFDRQDLRLAQQLAAQAAFTVDIVRLYEQAHERRRMEQELKVAHNFQEMLLPREFPRLRGLEVAAIATPALELGGDYYDFIWVEKPIYLGVAIVDVSGKGVPGALVMTILRSALRTAAPGCISPKRVLQELNKYIYEDTKENVFVTMTYAIVNVKAKTVRFARAGHEPMIICNEDGCEPQVLQPNGLALGLVGDQVFDILEEQEIQLREGDSMMLYTDGVVEACNPEGEEFGPKRFHERLQKSSNATAQEQINHILTDIHNFTQGAPQADDITMVCLKYPIVTDEP